MVAVAKAEKKSMAKAMADKAEQSGVAGALGPFQRFGQFLRDVRTEMRKVMTPSRKEVQGTTLVVLVTVFLFALYFFGVDKVLGLVVDKLLAWARTA